MNFLTNVFQSVFSLATFPLQTLPYFSGSEAGLSLPDAWDGFLGGCACFAGVPPTQGPGVACDGAGLLLLVFVSVDMAFGCIALALVKVGSEQGIGQVVCSLASAVKLPASMVLFSCPEIMGPAAEPIAPSTWAGLALVLAGFLWHVGAGRRDPGGAAPDAAQIISRSVSLVTPV